MNFRISTPVFVLLLVLISASVFARPYNGDRFTFTQPDGTPFEVALYGDEYFVFIETADGFTLTKDEETGFYYYAKPAPDEMSFQCTAYKAEEELPLDHTLNKKYRLLSAAVNKISAAARKKFGVDARGQLLPDIRLRMRPEDYGFSRWTEEIEAQAKSLETFADGPQMGPPSSVSTGVRVGLILLAQFPDRPDDITITQAQVDAFANEPDYTDFDNATSVYGYFYQQSDGKLQYNCIVTAYFTAANPRSYYTDSSISYGTRAKELINEGLENLKNKGFDFNSVDADNNSVIDGVNLFYAGANVNSWSEGLWKHKWSSSWSGLSGEGVSTGFQYQITHMGTSLSIGDFCHENGHMICGFPDLYSYNGNAASLNDFSLMSVYGATHPVSIDPYLKLHAGWADIIDITSADHLRGALQVDQNRFYRFINPARTTEYFLLSLKTDSGYEGVYGGSSSSVNPANGLVVWHAYETGSNTYSSIFTADSPDASYNTPYELMVVEANPSASVAPWYDQPDPDSNDAYHSDDIDSVSDATTPALKFWNTSNGRTTLSGLNIHSVGPQGDNIVFTIGAGAVAGSPVIANTAADFSPKCDLGTNTSPQTFSIFNAGGGTLNYTLSENTSWLSLDSTSGTATTEADLITISYSTSGLEPGTYNGTIEITDAGAGNNPQEISVSLTVSEAPIITTDINEIETSIVSGTITTNSFLISNNGSGILHYEISESSPWLTLDTLSGTVKAEVDEIQMTLNASDLFEGTYSADITISDSTGASSTETIRVTLNVTGNILVCSPSGGNELWQGNSHLIKWRTGENVTGNVDIALFKNGSQESIIASEQENTGVYQWAVSADQTIGSDYRIRIISSEASTRYGESLSDFTISAMPSSEGIPYDEGFEADTGSWAQASDDDFDWTRDSGGTPSGSTGPATAHDGSFYLYTESSGPNYPGKTARIENIFDLRTASFPVLSFACHLNGETMGTLTVSASVDQVEWTTLFSKTGDQGSSWQTENIDLTQLAGQVVTLRIEGTTGSSYTSDMAIDAISITESSKKLTRSAAIFSEADSGNGSIANSIAFTLTGDTFTPDVISGGYVSAANAPDGLTAVFVRNSDTEVTMSLAGQATSHANKDSVFDLQVRFADGAFNSADASDVAGGTSELVVDFFDILYLLSINKTGIGTGSVASSPAGIDCGSGCSDQYSAGTAITLTATPDAYSWFSGWEGDCTGTGTCSITLSEETVITARFDAADGDSDGTPDHLDAFPDNPAYFDDGDNDGLPTAWETLYGLNTSLDDSEPDPDGDGLGNLDEFLMGTDPGAITNGPGIAVPVALETGVEIQTLTPTLLTDYSTFANEEMHAQTRWEISKNIEFTDIIFRTTSSTFKTEITVPHGILETDETLYWRAGYIDTDDLLWPWSAYSSFTAAAALNTDSNNNGLPDDMEVSDNTMDLDQNDAPDITQSGMHCITLPGDSGQVCLRDVENSFTTDRFSWVETDGLEIVKGVQEWFLNFKLSTQTTGATVSVTLFFSEPLPENCHWYMYDTVKGWLNFSEDAVISSDRFSVTLEITDGGAGDADGTENNIIVETSGPVTLSGSSGGCFIKVVTDTKVK